MSLVLAYAVFGIGAIFLYNYLVSVCLEVEKLGRARVYTRPACLFIVASLMGWLGSVVFG